MAAFYEYVAGLARSGVLPEMFEHSFMVRGLLAALVFGPVLGGMGTVVVTRNLSFFAMTVGNAALSGVAIGLLLGEPADATYAGLFGFCLFVALLMTYVRHRARIATDTVIGVILSQVLGLGIILLVLVTKQFNIHQVEAVLFGSLITLTDADLVLLAAVAAGASLVGGAAFNRTMLVSFNPVLAKARGVSPVLLEYVFITVLTAVIVAGLKLVGALLVLVLIVVPAASAQNVARNLRQFFWLSVAFASVSTVFGLLLSGVWPIPTGGAIVLVAGGLFYAALILRPLVRGGSAN